MRTLLAFAAIACLSLAQAGAPQPAWVLYGQAIDEYGWPCSPGVSIELQLNGRVVSTRTVQGSIRPGVNYIFRIPLDSGSGTPYVPGAARANERFSVTLVQTDGRRILIQETNLPPVGRPGEVVRLNLSAGTDSDGDGLPDEWEQWIIDHGTGFLTLHDIRPQDDFDGDGVSNLDEFRAGTDPAWNGDYFQIDEWTRVSGDLFQMRFISVPGKTYELLSAPMPAAGGLQWQTASYAKSPTGEFSTGPFEASGYEVTIFVRPTSPHQLFRLSVH